MTKRTFLKKLEDALEILREDERQDIINEYKDHIKQKMKDGATEAEAIKSFGEFDTIVEEILEAYKINNNYKQDDEFTSFIKSIDHYVNLAVDKVKEVFNNIDTKNPDGVFDIIVKVILILFAIWLVRIPFFIVEAIGRMFIQGFFPFMFTPINVIWVIIINLAYVLALVLIIRSLVLNLYKPNSKDKAEEKPKPKKEEGKPKSKPKTKAEKKEEPVKTIEPSKNNTGNDVVNFLFIIFKLWLILLCLPLFGIIFACIIGIIVLIYLAISGVFLLGPILLLVGIWMCSWVVIDFVFTLRLRGDSNG